MNAASDPTSPFTTTPAELIPVAPTPLYPGSQMVPVDFTRPDPLPPPPTKERVAMIRVGTALAAAGSGILIVALFITPWFFVREVTLVQPPTQTQGPGNTSNQPNINSFSTRIVQRDLHDFGVVGWASTRRVKRDVAIVALALIAGIAVLMGSVSYRWRPLIALAGGAALAVQALTLIDYQRLTGLIRERVALANSPTSAVLIPANLLKITGPQPGTGMVVLFVGAACIVVGSLIALMGGRRGKVLAPVQQ